MTIKINPNLDRLTVDDLIAIDEGALTKPRAIRNLLARFVVNDAGEYLETAQAQIELGGLTVNELKKVIQEFGAMIKGVADEAVTPLTSGG